MRQFFKSIRLSDFFLLGASLISILVVIPSYPAFERHSLEDVVMPIWISYLSFAVSIILWIIYVILEVRKGRFKIPPAVTVISVVLLILNVITIASQPEEITVSAKIYNSTFPNYNSYVDITTVMPIDIKVFSIVQIITILTVIYFLLFALTTRFKKTYFITFVGILFMILGTVSILYSWFFEFHQYGPFLEGFFAPEFNLSLMHKNATKSFFMNKNAFAIILFLSMMFMMINHSIYKRKFYYFFIALFYSEIFFTFSRTSYVFSSILLALFFYFKLFDWFERKALGITITVFISALVAVGLTFLILYVPYVQTRFFTIFYSNGGTFSSRTLIWNHVTQIVKPSYWFFGRGYGVFNTILSQVNRASFGGDGTVSAHSWFFSLLGKGGIFFVGTLLALSFSALIFIFKYMKRNYTLMAVLLMSLLCTVGYCCFEDFHYIILLVVFVIFYMAYHFKTNPPQKPVNYTRIIVINTYGY